MGGEFAEWEVGGGGGVLCCGEGGGEELFEFCELGEDGFCGEEVEGVHDLRFTIYNLRFTILNL